MVPFIGQGYTSAHAHYLSDMKYYQGKAFITNQGYIGSVEIRLSYLGLSAVKYKLLPVST